MKYINLIWDFDGMLFNTYPRMCASFVEALRRMGVVLKRAQYFITCSGKAAPAAKMTPDSILSALITAQGAQLLPQQHEQLSLFQNELITREEVVKCISGQI